MPLATKQSRRGRPHTGLLRSARNDSSSVIARSGTTKQSRRGIVSTGLLRSARNDSSSVIARSEATKQSRRGKPSPSLRSTPYATPLNGTKPCGAWFCGRTPGVHGWTQD
ncbi:MAG: hypothetical protein LBT00_03320 [Spirochaetaceae bacterium]|nr:hypothetical protein [Spirochaetaceae bacterium]